MENNEINDIEENEDNKTLKNPKRGRIYIRNLPFKINEEGLKQAFSKFGEINEVF
jgi:RNA recognition motif-containing protein